MEQRAAFFGTEGEHDLSQPHPAVSAANRADKAEEDGLALSSRNARLSVEERKNALKISQTLFESRTFAASHTVAETQKFVEDAIAAAPGLRLEYFELVDGNTLQKIANWEDTAYAVGCITVFCGEVRLIDNIKYKE